MPTECTRGVLHASAGVNFGSSFAGWGENTPRGVALLVAGGEEDACLAVAALDFGADARFLGVNPLPLGVSAASLTRWASGGVAQD